MVLRSQQHLGLLRAHLNELLLNALFGNGVGMGLASHFLESLAVAKTSLAAQLLASVTADELLAAWLAAWKFVMRYPVTYELRL